MTNLTQILNDKMIEIENMAAAEWDQRNENIRIAKLIAFWHRAEKREFMDRAARNMARFEDLRAGWEMCKRAKAGERNEAFQWAAGIYEDTYQAIMPGFEELYENGELDTVNPSFQAWVNGWEPISA